jgi:hypothetical protein
MHRKLLLLLGLFIAVGAIAQVVGERLLPASVTREVTIRWKQDGRVAEIEISNPKQSPVLTVLVLDLQYEALPPRPLPAAPLRSTPPPKKPGGSATTTLDLEAGERYLAEIEAKTTVQLKVAVQPGVTEKSQVELKPDRKLIGLTLREARGRDQTSVERLKSRFF